MKGSVWSALPTTNVSASSKEKPIVLAVASMDSASFFRDKILCEDSPLSVSSRYCSKVFTCYFLFIGLTFALSFRGWSHCLRQWMLFHVLWVQKPLPSRFVYACYIWCFIFVHDDTIFSLFGFFILGTCVILSLCYWSVLKIYFSLAIMQIVFVVFTGEAWGYLGSRRFLFELDQQTDAVNGINNTLIETVNTC